MGKTDVLIAFIATLADTVRRVYESNPALIKFMGGKDLKVRKMWLDILYPPAPPPRHFISG